MPKPVKLGQTVVGKPIVEGVQQDSTITPVGLRPFIALGIDFLSIQGLQAAANCTFCMKDGKFYVHVESGLWDCKRCGASGNPLSFLREVWKESDKLTTDYKSLAAERPPISEETLMLWGCCRSIITSKWLVREYDLTVN